MEVIYVGQKPTSGDSESIFLAGLHGGMPWQFEALSILKRAGFQGRVFIPLTESGSWLSYDYLQNEWELEYLELATAIAFWFREDQAGSVWFARSEVQYGLYLPSGKIVLGHPRGVYHVKYLDLLASHYEVPTSHTLEGTLSQAIGLSHRLWKNTFTGATRQKRPLLRVLEPFQGGSHQHQEKLFGPKID